MNKHSLLPSSLALLLCASTFMPILVIAQEPASITKTAAATSSTWQSYYQRSKTTKAKDTEIFTAELQRLGAKKAILPPKTKEFGFDPNPKDEWFSSPEGKAIMEAILSFQTPSGGWSKRTDMSQPRKLGMAYGVEKDYIPTFDNDATITQLTLLARGIQLTQNPRYKTAFVKGLNLVLEAQYPNGGWPQNYPLVGSYHDFITYNDALIGNILTLLQELSTDAYGSELLDSQQRHAVNTSLARGLGSVLATQYVQKGKKTIWGAQHHPVSLQPVKARAYEMASLATEESRSIVTLLMQIESPSPEIQQSIHDAISWFKATSLQDTTWVRGTSKLLTQKGAPDLWGRFYDLTNNRPVFGDRDGSVTYDISKISQERLEGYAWFTTGPNKLIKEYEKWLKKHKHLSNNVINHTKTD